MAVSKSLIRTALGFVGARAAQAPKHPLFPAAIRVERSRARHRGGRSNHTAWTVWFGSGPSLPSHAGGRRIALRATAGVLTAAAVGVATAIAAQRDAAQQREALRVDGVAEVPRLGT